MTLHTTTVSNADKMFGVSTKTDSGKVRLRAGDHPNQLAGMPLADEPDREIRDYIGYSPESGVFTWIKPRMGIRVGDRCGWFDPDGYVRIVFNRRNYSAHRLAWYFFFGVWPKQTIDHRNGQRDDNRIANLREATRSQQCANSRGRSGLPKGVRRTKFGRYTARIQLAGTGKHLGTFGTVHEAADAYTAAAFAAFGEFARAV